MSEITIRTNTTQPAVIEVQADASLSVREAIDAAAAAAASEAGAEGFATAAAASASLADTRAGAAALGADEAGTSAAAAAASATSAATSATEAAAAAAVLGTTPQQFGAVGDGVANDTPAFQAAVDFVAAAGGGNVFIPAGDYLLNASTLTESFDNAGATIAATAGCIVLRSKVSLVADDDVLLRPSSPALHVIMPISPDGNTIKGLSIDGGWTGVSGAGHGILQLQTIGNEYCRNFTITDVSVKNVASYGIGIQNGDLDGVTLQNIKIKNTGADGIDFKTRGPTALGKNIKLDNILVDTFGQRTGLVAQAGIDIRGESVLTNIHIYNVGANAVPDQRGVRFRTLGFAGDPSARGSSMAGFYIEGVSTSGGIGWETGSPDTRITGGMVKGIPRGVFVTGNADGNALRTIVTGVLVEGATAHAFRVLSDTTDCLFSGCISEGSAVGFRTEAARTTFSGCISRGDTDAYQETAAASGTSNIINSRFYDRSLDVIGNATDRIRLLAKGPAADLDIAFEPKGAGRLRFGTRTASGDVPVTGYVEIKDSGGTIRRLAVVG